MSEPANRKEISNPILVSEILLYGETVGEMKIADDGTFIVTYSYLTVLYEFHYLFSGVLVAFECLRELIKC